MIFLKAFLELSDYKESINDMGIEILCYVQNNGFIEPTCATCMVGSYALLSACPSVVWTGPKRGKIIHISGSIRVRNLQLHQNILRL